MNTAWSPTFSLFYFFFLFVNCKQYSVVFSLFLWLLINGTIVLSMFWLRKLNIETRNKNKKIVLFCYGRKCSFFFNYIVINEHCYSCTGFVTSKVACCGQGPYNGLGLCTAASNLCSNRDQYAFWDAFHPSEKANRIIVQQILSGTNAVMYPMNLSTILDMDSRT